MRSYAFSSSAIAVLPRAPVNASPVPWLTSLYSKSARGPYGDPRYPGNCSGELIKDVLRFFGATRVLDPMSGSGTCADVCRELGIACVSGDIAQGFDACDPRSFVGIGTFDFLWAHPPYWRMKCYTGDKRDLSNCPTLDVFLNHLGQFIRNGVSVLRPGGRFAILVGDYNDHAHGFVPLTYETKKLGFAAGLKQACTDIIRFSHGASSSRKTYRSSFIPGLHDVLSVFEKHQ